MKKRVVSAILMLFIFIPLLIIGGIPFDILIVAISLMATYELLKLKDKIPLIIKIFTYIFTAMLVINNYNSNNLVTIIDLRILIVLILFYLISIINVNNEEHYNYKDAFFLISQVLLIGIVFNSSIQIRNIGLYLLLYLFLITVATDTFALLVGMKFGKHKLAPKISPNKTIEGSIGGSILGTIIASLFHIFVIGNASVYLVIIFTFLLTIVGQLGDLFFSSIKRKEKIKDFSNLIPGHGGILDRLDSIIFVILAYILISGWF